MKRLQIYAHFLYCLQSYGPPSLLNTGNERKLLIVPNGVFAFACFIYSWLGQLDFEEEEAMRPKFKGQVRRNPVDDNMNDFYYPENIRRYKMLFAMIISFLFVGLVILCVFGLIYFQTMAIAKYKEEWFGKHIAKVIGIIMGIQIGVFNFLYGKVALLLTDFENHRTQSAYENSLIAKTL